MLQFASFQPDLMNSDLKIECSFVSEWNSNKNNEYKDIAPNGSVKMHYFHENIY